MYTDLQHIGLDEYHLIDERGACIRKLDAADVKMLANSAVCAIQEEITSEDAKFSMMEVDDGIWEFASEYCVIRMNERVMGELHRMLGEALGLAAARDILGDGNVTRWREIKARKEGE